MKNLSHTSNRSSRRQFIGSVATVATAATALGETKRAGGGPTMIMDEHIPPIGFTSGSLIVETFLALSPATDTKRRIRPKRHRYDTRGIEKVRVVALNGDLLYRDDAAAGSTIEIWHTSGTDDAQILVQREPGKADKLEIQVDQELVGGKITGNPYGYGARYVHQEPKASIKAVKITSGTMVHEITEGGEVAIHRVLIWPQR